MRATLGPLAESMFALDLFARNNNVVFTAWRRQVRHRLGERVDAVSKLVPLGAPVPNLLALLEQPTELDSEQQRVMTTLFEFSRAAVLPYWGRTRSHLELEREARGRIVITKGVEHLLRTLHPKVHWRPPVLEIPDERHSNIHLDSHGLLLSPSLFLVDRPCVVLDTDRSGVPPTLVFSLPLTATAIATLCCTTKPNDQALSALVGQTRAAALRALAESCTTSELAHRLNISSAGASQHATVLRDAGLITTCRDRNTVLHALTPLGVALLEREIARPRLLSGG